jgi:hypothetical protein
MQVPLRKHWTDPIKKFGPKALLVIGPALLVFEFMLPKHGGEVESVQDGLRFVLSDGGRKLSVSRADDSDDIIAFPSADFGRVRWGDQVWLIDGREDKLTSLEQDQRRTLNFGDLVCLHPGMTVSFEVVPHSGAGLIIEPKRSLSKDARDFVVHQMVHVWSGHLELSMP